VLGRLLRLLEERGELLVALGVAVVELERALGERDRLVRLAARAECLRERRQRAHVALVDLEDASIHPTDGIDVALSLELFCREQILGDRRRSCPPAAAGRPP
jgi:hypothetical protein